MTERSRPCRCTGEEGTTNAVELVIASIIILIVLVAAFITVNAITKVTVANNQLGTSSQAAQVNLNEIHELIGTTSSPTTAYLAASLTSSSYACWGWDTAANSKDPGNQTNAPANLAYNVAGLSEPFGVVVAHDFEYEFCGFRPNSSVPHVFDIRIDTTTCGGSPYCTLKIYDYGQYGDGTAGNGVGKVIYTIPNVWCDQTHCQNGSAGTGTNDTPALFTYYNSSAATLTNSQCTCGAGDDSNANYVSYLTAITSVQIHFTVLARTTNKHLPISGGNPGTSLLDQVRLVDMGG